uniref:Uncharacterized protein n=1 Tax=Arion vulgaris TaxID=1028688 RepID=A0A0B6ZPZ9_9EUPU
MTYLASKSNALQQRVKQSAHSPHRPRRVSNNLSAFVYRGNLFTCAQEMHL